MKAFIVNKYGGKDNLQASEIAAPEVHENDVLIQIKAAGVNPVDYRIRDGEFKLILPYRLPFVLGNDFAGVVERVGSSVTRFKPGDEVYGRPEKERIGSFAEYVAVNEDVLARKPKTVSMEEAASIPLVGLTAWQALVERAKVKKGQKVLIHGGAGGVGSVAIQLAKYLGAIVATTTGTEKIDWVKKLGADIVIDYKKDSFEKLLHDYDVVFDTQGGEILKKSLTILKEGGIAIGITGPPDPEFAKENKLNIVIGIAMHFMSYKVRKWAKDQKVRYSFLFMQANGHQLEKLTTLYETGALRTVVDKVFPFASTKEALEHVEKGGAKGKIVISMQRPGKSLTERGSESKI